MKKYFIALGIFVCNFLFIPSNAQVFYSNDFSNSSEWTLSAPNIQGQWEYVLTTPGDLTTYMGDNTSTTNSNGFIAFNGVQFLLAGSVDAQDATAELNTAIDLSAYPAVSILFEQRYMAFNYDQTFLEVSGDNGATWTQIEINQAILTNDPATQNQIILDVSPYIGGAAQAKIRFRWLEQSGDDSYGSGYGWMVDDLKIIGVCIPSVQSDIQLACDSLLWIDGNTYYASNNTATHTLTNAAGCDSVITLDLTILNNSGTDTQTTCDSSLNWIDGNTYYASNNTATHTLTNAAGCDSVVTLDLTITNSTSGIDAQTACDSLNWIDGNTYYASNNTAAHTLTNAAGCDSAVTLDLTIINSTASTDTQTTCDSYVWIDGNSYTASNNTATHILTNTAGCDSVVSLDLTVAYSSASSDTVVACGEYTWMDGNTYTVSTTSPNYTLTNAVGCDSIISLNLTINDNNFNPDYTVSSQLFTAPPFAAMFTNNTLNFSDYDFTWDFGDGTILQSNNVSVFHEYLYNGLYDVTLIAVHTVTGCSDTLHFDDYIFCTGGTACSHASTIDQAGPITGCLSDSVFLTCNTAPSFTYQWRLNGTYIAGATDTIYYPTQSGNYSVLIMDAGCPEVSPDISITMSLSPTTPVITSTGSITPCIGGSVTMSTTTSYDTYQWSSGGTGATEVVNASGNYTVTVGNASGCEVTSAPYTINAAAGSPPNVCIVGVDSASNYNRVVWEKPITSAIDSFYVYKESSAAGVYQKIGGTAYNDTAVFNDLSSNPAVQAYRYRISLFDSCGTESAMGDIHKSIHLTINQGVGTDWNLIWSHYEGFTFPSYNIYRGTSPTSMAPLTTIASTLNSYTDVTAPAGTVYYQIEVVSSYTCDPAKANYNISRSNIADNSGAAGLNDLNSIQALLYPNPTDGRFTLKLQSDISGKVEVTNNLGQVIFNAAINGTTTTIDLGEDCSAGLYFVALYNEYGELVNQQKLIVQ